MREWPKEKYGTFFSGDSYIILHTEKASPDSDVCICFQFTFLELLVSLYKLIGKIIIGPKWILMIRTPARDLSWKSMCLNLNSI